MPTKKSSSQKTIRASEIYLEDSQGNVRACLMIDPKSQAVIFSMLGHSGSSLSFGIDLDGNPKIDFCRKGSRQGLSLGIWDHGAGLTVHDARGRPVVLIKVPPDEMAYIELIEYRGSRGRPFWTTSNPPEDR
jgi:hypothetical protein